MIVSPALFASRDQAVAAVSSVLALEGVLRVKGYATLADKSAPLIVQGVGDRVETVFGPPGTGEGLVVIGLKGFDRSAVTRLLAGR